MRFETASVRIVLAAAVSLLGGRADAKWLPLEDVATRVEDTDLGGPRLTISYRLPGEDISEERPAYVFVRYRTGPDEPWRLLPRSFSRGDGLGIVTSAGEQRIGWWGGTMLDGKLKLFGPAHQVEAAIEPSVQISRAAQRLTGR